VTRLLAAWGRIVHRRGWLVLAGSVALVALSVVGLMRGGSLVSGNELRGDLEASRATRLAGSTAQPQVRAGSSFVLLFRGRDLMVTDPAFRTALEAAVAPFLADPRVVAVQTPYGGATAPNASLVSHDRRVALVRVLLRDSAASAQRYWTGLRAEIRPVGLEVQATGPVALDVAFTTTLGNDLRRAELVTLPLVLLLLLLIFGSVIAALLPVGVGVLTIIGGLCGTLAIAHTTDVSRYALNVVTLVGLGVSIDYSLFVVNRFREELAAGASREDALATTMATAGRAITFSGVTVAVGLSAMLFYQGTFLASMGCAGSIAVVIAVVYSLTFLPAMLAILGPRVDRLRLPLPRRAASRAWGVLARMVMRRPVLVLAPALGLLLVAASPFLAIRLANGTADMLPPGAEARQAFDTVQRDFPAYDQNAFTVVVRFANSDAGVGAGPARVAELRRRISATPGIVGVGRPRTGGQVAVLDAVSSLPAASDDSRSLLRDLRAERVPGAEVLVTGSTAYDVDAIDFILRRTPVAVGFVIGATLVLMFLLTGSVLLPVKAVLTNLVSISASFGALVWIFQRGHLSGLLGFTPQPIDPSIPLILFATVFGLSMDYEVLLVSRIQEEHRRTGDNVTAVAEGLARSGRLISGAALVMVVVFLAFGLAQVVLIKAIGIGLAIAVALDATVARGLIVPAVMRLLGGANWWAPPPLRWLHRRTGVAAETMEPPRAA
jgi:putative drug exporter of the RND superfamily